MFTNAQGFALTSSTLRRLCSRVHKGFHDAEKLLHELSADETSLLTVSVPPLDTEKACDVITPWLSIASCEPGSLACHHKL